MSVKVSRLAFAVGILLLLSAFLEAQSVPAGLSGIVTGLPEEATVSVKTSGTGPAPPEIDALSVRTLDTNDDSAGLPDAPSQAKTQAPLPGQSSPQSSPNAPSSSQTEPSLEDLGFPKEASQGDAKQQALLDKRTHMLKIHQKLGLFTTIPMVAAIISSAGAGGKQTSTSSRWLHVGLGAAAGDMYFTTAYFAIFAPKIAGTPTKGPIRVHKTLAWIHGPGMILTPILGAIAYNQKSRGEKVHGLGAAHMPVALVTAGAYGAALMAVSVKF